MIGTGPTRGERSQEIYPEPEQAEKRYRERQELQRPQGDHEPWRDVGSLQRYEQVRLLITTVDECKRAQPTQTNGEVQPSAVPSL